MRRIPLLALFVEAGIDVVHVLLVQTVLSEPQPLAEAYKMDIS